MTFESLDESYFKWLYVQVASARLKNPNRTFWNLLGVLHRSQFIWLVPHDDNRAVEGRELRYKFLENNPDVSCEAAWLGMDVSILEMMIALSGRLAFEDGRNSSMGWFWHLIGNLDIFINDEQYRSSEVQCYGRLMDALEMLNNRTYDQNGRGGLFPLAISELDQRHEEIWSQMNHYLIERS